MQPSRHQAVDIAKGIGIILVVLGHDPTITAWGWPGRMIFSFHMPLFFVISALFLRPADRLGDAALSRFGSILKPYFAVALLVAATRLVASAKGMVGPVDGAGLLLGILHGTGATLMWTPMWFLPHLFLASCTSLLLLKVLAARPGLVRPVAGLLLTSGVLAIGRVPELPWSADLLPVSAALMLAGWSVRDRLLSLRFHWAPVGLALLAFVTLNLAFDARMELNARVYDHLLVNTAEAAAGTYLVFATASLLRQTQAASRVLGHIGSASLFILIFHHPVQLRGLKALQDAGLGDLPSSALAVSLGVAVPILVWEAARRIPPMAWLLLPRHRPPNLRAPAAAA